jgi:hypothetical protein
MLWAKDQTSAARAAAVRAAAAIGGSRVLDTASSTIPCAAAIVFADIRAGSEPVSHGSTQPAATNR